VRGAEYLLPVSTWVLRVHFHQQIPDLDEEQNLTPKQIKTLIIRAGRSRRRVPPKYLPD
jgi:hypothetical protein